jgi:transcriptional regulator with XRE-family HTH domain
MRRVSATPLRAFLVGALFYNPYTGEIGPRPLVNRSELARRSGVTRRTLERVVAGQPSLDLNTADKLVTAMGLHIDNLWGPDAGL